MVISSIYNECLWPNLFPAMFTVGLGKRVDKWYFRLNFLELWYRLSGFLKKRADKPEERHIKKF